MGNEKILDWWRPLEGESMMNQWIDYFSKKRTYKVLKWSDNHTSTHFTYEYALKLEGEGWILPSFLDFLELSKGELNTFRKGYYWGKEVHPHSNTLGFGYNTTHEYPLIYFIPERTAMVRLIRIDNL